MKLRRIIPFLLLISCICIYGTGSADAADLLSGFQPYVTIKEQYTDNLNLTPTNKKDDFITTIEPGVTFSNMDRRKGVELDYALGAVFYSTNSNLDYISHRGSLNAKYMTPQRINFYLRDYFIRSDTPREREYFTTDEDNRYVLATQTERSTYWRNVLAPTVEYQFGANNRLGLNYRNNLYRTSSINGQDSRENYINPFFSYWIDRRNAIDLDYSFTHGNFERSPNLKGHRWSARHVHRLSPLSSISTEYAFSRRTFAAPGLDYHIHEPSIGITHEFTRALSGSAQAGYYWKRSDGGVNREGFSYRGELKNTIDPRTTFILSLQGGYTEDYFTAENLGFNRYHRLTGSLTHRPARHMSIGGFGSVEKAKLGEPSRSDTIWAVGARTSWMPLKWLRLALEISRRERDSSVAAHDYTENRAMLTISAVYQQGAYQP